MTEPQFAVVSLYGLSWYKNASEQGGAMKEVIKNCQQGNVVIHSQTKKYGRLWSSCSPDKLCSLIKKNCGIYEVITSYPHKLYFDIDNKEKTPDAPLILPTIMEHIKSIWSEGNWAISGSNTPEKESYHIVSDTYVIHNEAERDMVKCAVKHLLTKHPAFDWKVYTTNRNMKCINQSKDDGRVQAILDNQDYKAHLICSFIPTYCKPIDCNFDEELKENIAIAAAHKKFDLSELPRISLPTPENINPFELTPKQILDLLPYKSSTKSFNFKYVHMVARFCYHNGIEFEDYLAWGGWKMSPEGIKLWNALEKFPPFSIERMKKVLHFYYPAFKRDQHFNKFVNQFKLPDTILTTPIERLSQDHYSPDHKFTILHLTMGSGKTAQTIDYLKNSFGGFCWIAHNKALVAGTLTRLHDADVECKSYLALDAKKKKEGGLNKFQNLCICAHSLHYISTDKRYRVLVIDEIESVVDAFIGDFMNKSAPDIKAKSFAVFKNLILTSEKVILIDAFITMKTINLIQLIDPHAKINLIMQSNVTPSKTLIFRNSTRESNDDPEDRLDYLSNSINEICQYVAQQKRVFIFYPYKNSGINRFSMQQVLDTIKSRTNCRAVAYNSDVDDEIKEGLKDVNTTWSNFDVVICNSVVTCGVNFDLQGFDKVFMFLAGFVAPRQAIQVSARIRNLQSNEIIVYYMGRQNNPECYKDDRQIMNCIVYNRLYEDFVIEDQAPRRKSFELFCTKAPYKMKVDTFVIDSKITKEILDMCNNDFEFRFENLEEISQRCAEQIENSIMLGEATMIEKFLLKKFYYVLKFPVGTDNELIKETWNLNMFGIVN